MTPGSLPSLVSSMKRWSSIKQSVREMLVLSFACVVARSARDALDRGAGRMCTSAANSCAERGENGRIRSPRAGDSICGRQGLSANYLRPS